jgi:predicted nucleic acid-binding protein
LAPAIAFDEYMRFVELNRLYGAGIGIVDVHLLASALLADATLWTDDKRLKKAAQDLSVAYRKK